MYISELYNRIFVFTDKGKQFAGPFESRKDAQEWIDKIIPKDAWKKK